MMHKFGESGGVESQHIHSLCDSTLVMCADLWSSTCRATPCKGAQPLCPAFPHLTCVCTLGQQVMVHCAILTSQKNGLAAQSAHHENHKSRAFTNQW